jgi:ubiquinone biosynthesis protein
MIRHTFRLSSIALTLARYRLDEVLTGLPPLKFARAVRLLPWGRRRVRELPRGERLRLALQALGPIFVKFGQILSTRRDLLPPISPTNWPACRTDVRRSRPGPGDRRSELGRSRSTVVRRVRQHAAGLGLDRPGPRRAPARSGREVVVKVLRPGIRRRSPSDIEAADQPGRLVRATTRAATGSARWRRGRASSSDAGRRARPAARGRQRQPAAAQLARTRDDLYVPEPFCGRYTAERVLTMERVSGIRCDDIAELDAAGVNRRSWPSAACGCSTPRCSATTSSMPTCTPATSWVDASQPDDPRFMALDFGIVGSLPDATSTTSAENFMAMFNRDYRRIAELHVEAGWMPPR